MAAEPPLVRSAWVPSEDAVLRMAGFGFEWLERCAPDGAGPPAGVASVDFSTALAAGRRALYGLAGDQTFQEAVWLSNPAAYERIRAYREAPFSLSPNSKTRRIERLIATYLQRFCAKNESASFFGPVAYAAVDAANPVPLSATFSGRLQRRRVHMAHWAANTIAQARTPGCAPLPTLTWTPLDHAPDAAGVREVFSAALDAFAAADLTGRTALMREIERRFRELTGVEPRRAAGTAYGDRMMFSEECAYDAGDLRIARSILEPFTGPQATLLDVLTFPARLALDMHRSVFRDFCVRRFGCGAAVPLPTIRQTLAGHPGLAEGLRRDAAAEWRKRVSPFLGIANAAANEGHPGRAVDCARTFDALADAARRASVQPWPCVASCDLLIAARDVESLNEHRYALVLGELHHSVSVNGFYASMHPARERFGERLRTLLEYAAGDREPVTVITHARNKTYVAVDPGLRDLVIGGAALPGKAALGVDALRVYADDRSIELLPGDSSMPLFICGKVPAGWCEDPLFLFASPPCSMSTLADSILGRRRFLPRLAAGRTILTRETWRLDRETLRASLEHDDARVAFACSRDLRSRYGWPRHVFVRFASGEKPLFVDWDNWLLLDVLRHYLRRCPAGEVDIAEMLPGPDQLWLRDAAGRHTNELRLTFVNPSGVAA